MNSFLFALLICIVGLSTDKATYILSRLYEGGFFYFQYNYFGLNDRSYYKELTYGEKVVCLETDFSKEMEAILKEEEPEKIWVFSLRKNMKTYWVEVNGKQYIVKRHEQRGFFKNIFQMGKGVSIWNNLKWAKKKGISVVTPVAFYEKREPSRVLTKVLYRFEEKRADDRESKNIFTKTRFITEALLQAYVVHADLRRRNIVYSNGEDQLKLIDVELMHYYPRWSYVCRKRLKKEEEWLLKD